LANVTIGNGVTSIGGYAFYYCTSLTNITIGNGVINIGDYAFYECASLVSITIPASVSKIGVRAFNGCSSLSSVRIPGSVTNLGDNAFYNCTNLIAVYFLGNAPSVGFFVFAYDWNGYIYYDWFTTFYYLPGTTGWDAFSASTHIRGVLWNPQAQSGDASFGVRTNRFGFNITGSSNLVIVVEACTNLANPVWTSVSTNTLNSFIGTNGTSYFSDPQWTNYPGRFYRLRSP